MVKIHPENTTFSQPEDRKFAILAIAKDEGQFLVEWLAHAFAVGFQSVTIGTNDCSDASVELLKACGEVLPVFQFDNSEPIEALTVQQRGLQRGLVHSTVRASEWILHIDIDEFLFIDTPSGKIDDFPLVRDDVDAIVFHWREFGSSEIALWKGGLVTEEFRMASKSPQKTIGHKTMFRTASFQASTPHIPKAPTKEPSDLRILTAQGVPVDNERAYSKRGTVFMIPEQNRSWDKAAVFHYVTKSRDLSLLKNQRGNANGRNIQRRLLFGEDYLKRDNNDVRVDDIDKLRDERERIRAKLMSNPRVSAAHEACLTWFERHRKESLTPSNILRWTHPLAHNRINIKDFAT